MLFWCYTNIMFSIHFPFLILPHRLTLYTESISYVIIILFQVVLPLFVFWLQLPHSKEGVVISWIHVGNTLRVKQHLYQCKSCIEVNSTISARWYCRLYCLKQYIDMVFNRELLLTYLYLFVYITLSSGVILYNKVNIFFINPPLVSCLWLIEMLIIVY